MELPHADLDLSGERALQLLDVASAAEEPLSLTGEDDRWCVRPDAELLEQDGKIVDELAVHRICRWSVQRDHQNAIVVSSVESGGLADRECAHRSPGHVRRLRS